MIFLGKKSLKKMEHKYPDVICLSASSELGMEKIDIRKDGRVLRAYLFLVEMLTYIVVKVSSYLEGEKL